jgi:hypothetical protein
MSAIFLLPSGEGGAKRRMRVGSWINVGTIPDPHPNPSPGGRGAQERALG